ncbi:RNA polymerase sigma-54 factor rpoN [Borrelia hermsii YBT]|uniref:RNA polymerase factor sigma-54 n=1 Tax=Borrelia hermsii TaxID=140 RepID=UPI0003E3B0BF|nr:hypothetical protein [Borrelia hermsii]AHH12472.1 RNA polymerase sigma-54 factor rpoN [Borrelia hermsii YBT]
MISLKKEDWPQATKIIKLIQQFDPIEICVPNIIESLILQAKYHKLDSNIIKILERTDLLENTQDKLKEELNINSQNLNDALNTISLKLTPNPTFEFKDKNDTNNYIEPDIIIISKGNTLNIKIKEVNISKKDAKNKKLKIQ